MSLNLANIPAILLCGGRGILLEQGGVHRINKALIEVHQHPLLWWNFLHYACHGVRDFIVAAGEPVNEFHEVLVNIMGAKPTAGESGLYSLMVRNMTCQVRLVATGLDATTSERLQTCAPWVANAPTFCMTYSDTLSDINLSEELSFHRQAGGVVTLLAAEVPVRFRILGLRQGEHVVRGFAKKPVIQSAPINGGYYFIEREALWEKYLSFEDVSFETEPLERLAAAGKLVAFQHQGAWQHIDCERDMAKVEGVARLLAQHYC